MKHPVDDYIPKKGALIRHIDEVLSTESRRHSPQRSASLFKKKIYGSHPILYELGKPLLKSIVALFRSCRDLLVVKTSHLVGDGVKTEPAIRTARRTARVGTASNIWNSLPIFPALTLMLGELGVASVPVSLLLTVGLCIIQNYLTAKLVQEYVSPKLYHTKLPLLIKFVKSPAAVAFILVNFSLSSLSFPLGIYLNSKAPLSESYAQVKVFPEIVAENQRVIELKEKEIKLVEREADCKKGREEIVELGSKPNSTQDNGRSRLIVEYLGVNTKFPFSSNSICGKAIRDREALNKLEAEIQAPLVAAKQAAAARALPSVTQLKEFFPEKYASLFTEEGVIKSPSTALAFSLEYSARTLLNKESGALLFPLLTLIISVALSYATLAMTIALANDPDIRMSFDPESAHLIAAILQKEEEHLQDAQK